MMVPYSGNALTEAEVRFNTKHSTARNHVERTIGLLKTRFRCLQRARELQLTPDKAGLITNVCAALHNICIENREEDNFDGYEPVENINIANIQNANESAAQARQRAVVRNNISAILQ